MKIDKNQNKEEDPLIFNLSVAATVVYKNLPEELTKKFSFEDIFDILSIQEEYLRKVGKYNNVVDEKPITDTQVNITVKNCTIC